MLNLNYQTATAYLSGYEDGAEAARSTGVETPEELEAWLDNCDHDDWDTGLINYTSERELAECLGFDWDEDAEEGCPALQTSDGWTDAGLEALRAYNAGAQAGATDQVAALRAQWEEEAANA